MNESPGESILDSHFFREEYGKLVAVMTGYLGVDRWLTAEDIVQETLLKATEHWKHNGLPPNPHAWLYTTAKRLCLNAIKRDNLQQQYHHYVQREKLGDEQEEISFSADFIQDELLKMMFVCCHPILPPEQQMALTLRTLCGFSQAEIASAFFSNKETINKRLVRARNTLRRERVQFEWPSNVEARQERVLEVIYLIFNEGYKAFAGAELIRQELCLEAIRLLHLIEGSAVLGQPSKTEALLALMYLDVARFPARKNSAGELLELEKQDWGLWNRSLIDEGLRYLTKASEGVEMSRYHILAAISAHYCTAPNYQQVNWQEILALYNHLLLIEPSPIVQMNRSIVLAKVEGNPSAITILLELQQIGKMQNYYLLPAIIAELYRREGQTDLARKYLEQAVALATNKRENHFLQKKLNQLVPI